LSPLKLTVNGRSFPYGQVVSGTAGEYYKDYDIELDPGTCDLRAGFFVSGAVTKWSTHGIRRTLNAQPGHSYSVYVEDRGFDWNLVLLDWCPGARVSAEDIGAADGPRRVRVALVQPAALLNQDEEYDLLDLMQYMKSRFRAGAYTAIGLKRVLALAYQTVLTAESASGLADVAMYIVPRWEGVTIGYSKDNDVIATAACAVDVVDSSGVAVKQLRSLGEGTSLGAWDGWPPDASTLGRLALQNAMDRMLADVVKQLRELNTQEALLEASNKGGER
jgi:hypothetical protein